MEKYLSKQSVQINPIINFLFLVLVNVYKNKAERWSDEEYKITIGINVKQEKKTNRNFVISECPRIRQ